MPESFTYHIAISIVPHRECQTSTGVGALAMDGIGSSACHAWRPISPSLNFCNFSFKRKVNEYRMYDPVMSTFLSVDAYVQDPTSAQGFNRYAYCSHNPLRYVDPTGWSNQPFSTPNVAPPCNPIKHTTYSSDDPNDMLWGYSHHPCSSGGQCNGANVTCTKITEGNNGNGNISIIGNDGVKTNYTPGMTYIGNDQFTRKTVDYLNHAVENSETAARMINEMIASGFSFDIVEGNENRYSPSNNAMHYGDDSNSTTFYDAGGGTITFDLKGTQNFEKMPNETISKLVSRPEMNLMHELAHGWDNSVGLLVTNQQKFENLKVCEWTACRTENAIRSEMSLPLRTSYGIQNFSNGAKPQPDQPMLYDKKGEYRYMNYLH